MAGMAMILYGSSVVIPQLAQATAGLYCDALGAGDVTTARYSSCCRSRWYELMPIVQDAYNIAFGFFLLDASFVYRHG